MIFKVKLKNVGKLTDAEIRIGRFTVFAGPNNAGKSFVSKLLYSLFDAMNANHAEVHINNLLVPVRRALTRLDQWVDPETGKPESLVSTLGDLEEEVNKMENLVKETSFNELEQIIPTLISQTERMLNRVTDIQKLHLKEVENKKQSDFSDTWGLSREVVEKQKQVDSDSMINSLVNLKKTLGQNRTEIFIVGGIHHKIRQNLIHNFQVPRISDIGGKESDPLEINIDGFGEFEFSNRRIKSKINGSWMKQLHRYSQVIYLESPVYWKLKGALEDTRDYPKYFYEDSRERLSGVPGYFHDLVRALKFEYTGDIAFPEVYEWLTGSDVISGKIAISESGNLSFQENGRSFSMPVTAMGIANLGILALLIERKVLDKGSFIFIDEPEAHLHPAWQVVMAEALFELSRQGANVVIATHSVDILKWLEVHAKKNPEDKDLIALNRFPVNSSEVDEDFETKMANIKQELTKPFSDLYLEGI